MHAGREVATVAQIVLDEPEWHRLRVCVVRNMRPWLIARERGKKWCALSAVSIGRFQGWEVVPSGPDRVISYGGLYDND